MLLAAADLNKLGKGRAAFLIVEKNHPTRIQYSHGLTERQSTQSPSHIIFDFKSVITISLCPSWAKKLRRGNPLLGSGNGINLPFL